MRCAKPRDGVNTTTLRLRYSFTLSVIRVVAGRVRGAAKVDWGRAKSAPRAMRSRRRLWSGVPRRVAPRPYGKARRAEPTWRSLHAEACRAEGRGPKGRGEILGAKNWRRVQCVGELVCIERSAEARRAEVLLKGEARRAEPTCDSVHTEGPKVEARRAVAKFWVLLI